MHKTFKFITILLLLVLSVFAGCIKNDIPYPKVLGEITAIEVEGQEGVAEIDTDGRIVNIILADDAAVDPTNVKFLKLEVSNDAVVAPMMPEFLDLTIKNKYTLTTYQDYVWTVKGEQIVKRFVLADSLNGRSLIDSHNKLIIMYFKEKQDLSKIKVNEMKLGPTGATITPDPTAITDFKIKTSYDLKVAYRDIVENWTLSAVHGKGLPEEEVGDERAQMVNSNFDEWFKDGKVWYPNLSLSSKNYFWDSGNKGANTLGENNPTSPEESHVVSGKAVKMASTAVMSILAAGSVYVGEYLKTDGTGGILGFGRPFTDTPLKVKGHYDYRSGKIDKAREKDGYSNLLNTQDSCHIYLMLTDWAAPFTVNTNTKTFIEQDNPGIIAFGELKTDQNTGGYKEFIIDLEYRREGVKPKYILFVATASKYGDYFTGSTSSVLYLDEVELIYE